MMLSTLFGAERSVRRCSTGSVLCLVFVQGMCCFIEMYFNGALVVMFILIKEKIMVPLP